MKRKRAEVKAPLGVLTMSEQEVNKVKRGCGLPARLAARVLPPLASAEGLCPALDLINGLISSVPAQGSAVECPR